MRFLVTLLMLLAAPSVAFAQADQCFTDDYNALPTTDCGNNVCQSEVSDYYTYLNGTAPHVVDAMDYCDGVGTTPLLPADVRARLWERFEYAQANPTLGTENVPEPAAYAAKDDTWKYQAGLETSGTGDCEGPYGCRVTPFTRAELLESYTAKVVHAVWLDVADILPHKLTEYTEAETRFLVSLDELWRAEAAENNYERTLVSQDEYASWTTPIPASHNWYEDYQGAYAVMTLVLDHSPFEVWELLKAQNAHLANSPRTVINRALYLPSRTIHGNRCDAPQGRSIKDNMNVKNTRGYQRPLLDPSNTCYSPNLTTAGPTMPAGCNDRSAFTIAFLRAVNIPAYHRNGVQAEPGHSMWYMPHHKLVAHHGDDVVYGFYSDAAEKSIYQDYASSILVPSSCLESEGPNPGFPYKVGDHEAAILVARQHCGMVSFMHPTDNVPIDFCGLGFEYARGTACSWAFADGCSTEDQAFLDQWKARWAAKYSCSGDPPP